MATFHTFLRPFQYDTYTVLILVLYMHALCVSSEQGSLLTQEIDGLDLYQGLEIGFRQYQAPAKLLCSLHVD